MLVHVTDFTVTFFADSQPSTKAVNIADIIWLSRKKATTTTGIENFKLGF